MKPLTAYLGKEKVTIINFAYIRESNMNLYLVRCKNNKEQIVCKDELRNIK